MSRRLAPFVFTGLFFFAVLRGFAARLENELGAVRQGFNLEDTLARTLGGARQIVGDELFLKADVYFHGGVAAKRESETAEEIGREGMLREEHESQASDWIARVNREVGIHEHYHLPKEKQAEMLPFLALGTALDPYNVEAILTAVFWLDKQLAKPEEAVRVLKKGIRDNPASWALEYSLAEIHFAAHDWPRAREHYLAALEKMKGKKTENFERSAVYDHLAECELRLGDVPSAAAAYEKVVEIYRDDPNPPPLKAIAREKAAQLSGKAGF